MPEPHRIQRLVVQGFRNLARTELEPGPRLNVLAGDNGQGKSNVLEAVHYVSTLRSFRGAPIDDLVQSASAEGLVDAERARLSATIAASPLPRLMEVGLSRTEPRIARLDGKRPRTTAVWLPLLPTVLFHPGDLALAQGGPDGRRALLDDVLSELDPAYANTLATYGKALRSRNRLLKAEQVDRRAVTSFDPLLAMHGAALGQARARLVDDLAPVATEVFHELFGHELEGDEGSGVPLDIAFQPRVEPTEARLLEALHASFEKDVARGFTAEGPHADDVVLRVRRKSARHHASQGQQRSIVLALKVAELEVLARRSGRVPILLLDDVSSELDATRNRRFFALLARMGGQVFLTTTDAAHIRIDGDRVDFAIERGVLRPCDI